MKKLVIILLSMTLILTSCGGGDTKEESKTEVAKEETKQESGIEVDKKLLTVDVTLPVSLIEEEGVDIETTLANAKNTEGISKVVLNDNDTVTYTMTKDKHNEMMASIEQSIKELIDELIASEDNSIVKIENSKDYKSFDVYVDPEKYNTLEMFNAIIFYMQGIMYNSFAGDNNVDVIVKFINNKTNEVIDEGSSKAFMDYSANNAEESAPVKNESVDNEIKIGTPFKVGKHEMTITGASIVTDYQKKPVLKIVYTFTNGDDESVMPFMQWSGKLFQNGIQETDFFSSDEIDQGIGQKEIRPGVTLENCQAGFSLTDMSPVEIEIDELISFTSKPYVLKLNPAEL